jgi:branched-chain amino acid transport system permease protein
MGRGELVPLRGQPVAGAALLEAAAAVVGSRGQVLLIIIQPVEPSVGREFIGRTFAICVLGGMSSLPGTLLASLLLGVAEALTATFVGPSWSPAVSFGLLLLTLAVRPAGILGR